MSALSAFLHPAVTREEKEVIISKRFLGEDGKPVPFKIRSLTQEENAAIIKAATRQKKVDGQWQDSIDANELSARTIVEATVFPDFRSAELCERYGTKDPVQVPGKMLLAGEFSRLIDAVSKLSGFDKSLDEEAKK
nr:MAG TPA: tail assembly chaperone protein [Caudoviricetes sp.]